MRLPKEHIQSQWSEDDQANARLSAAAPDLLLACHSALIALSNPHSANWRATALADLQSAIAKAEGNIL